MDELWYWILISVVITCHELGHATAAWCMGIRVKKVCLFFDPGFHLLSTGNRFKVEFCLGWLPLGGYCSLATSLDGVPPEQTADRCEAWKRCILDIAGVSTNFVLTVAFLFAFAHNYVDRHHQHPMSVEAEYVAQTAVNWTKRTNLGILSSIGLEPKGGWSEKASRPVFEPVLDDSRACRMKGTPWLLRKLAEYNLFIGLFNLIPMAPLDGGNFCFDLYRHFARREPNDNLRMAVAAIGFLALLALNGYWLAEYVISWFR